MAGAYGSAGPEALMDEHGSIRSVTEEEPLRSNEVALTADMADRLSGLDEQDRMKEYLDIKGKAARKAAKRKRARARKTKAMR